jgi:hypothetical protein
VALAFKYNVQAKISSKVSGSLKNMKEIKTFPGIFENTDLFNKIIAVYDFGN